MKNYPYNKAIEFLIQYGDKIAKLFKKEKVDWNAIDLNNSNCKNHITRYTNHILKQMIYVKVNTVNKKNKAVRIYNVP